MRYSHFEFVVILFKLTNALTIFLDLINKVFHDYLDKFIVVFIDNISVYSKSHKEHKQYLRLILQRLKQKQLYKKFSQCKFWLDIVTFLRHMVLIGGISVDLSKIKTVLNWQRSKIIKEVHSFLSLVGYYRRFIEGFTNLARPLTVLTKKQTQF